MQDIHTIRPPVQVGFDPMIFKITLMVLGGIILLTLLFFLIKKWWKKRNKPQDLKFLPKPMPPFETAIKDLKLLSQQNMNFPRLFYFDLTAVLRKYMGRSYHINAMEMTSREFIKGINTLGLGREIKKDIVQFQKLSDPFKYAGIDPQKEEVKKDLVFMEKLIRKIEKELKKEKDKEKQ